MFGFVTQILGWFMSLWTSLPQETKDVVTEEAVKAFEAFFKAYYRASQQETAK